MTEDINKLVKEAMHIRSSYIDALIAACLRENNCKATELVVVEQRLGDKITWTVRKKDEI